MRRRRYQVDTNKNSTFTLNINSMTDMFTLLLVFLLQTYSTAEVQLTPESDIRLPASTAMKDPTDSVKLSLSPNALKLDTKTLSALDKGEFKADDLEASDNQFIKPLFAELQKIAKENPEKAFVKEGKVLLQADQDLPYAVLRKVMYTASMAGFPQLKLVTMVGE